MLKIDGDISLECKAIIENDRSLKKIFKDLQSIKKDRDIESLLQEIIYYVKLSFDKESYFAIDHSLDSCSSRFKNTVKNIMERMLCREELSSLPSTLHMEVTSKCNISCIMCGRSFKSTCSDSIYRRKDIKYEDMHIDIFKRFKGILQNINMLALVGWGEPFMSPYFYEMIDIAKKFGVGVNFTTNGMNLCDEDFLGKIYIARNIFSINISFDGATESTFNSIRRGAQYHKVIDNIIKINELKRKYVLRNPALYFSFVAMKKNISELCLLVDLAAKLGIAGINVTFLTVHGESIRNESLFYCKELANRIFAEAKKKAQEKGVHVYLPEYFKKENTVKTVFSEDKEQSKKHTAGLLCDYPWTFAMIKANGDVMPCCAYEEPFGNVRKENFNKIWNNKKFQSLREAFKHGDIPAFCKSCNRFGDINHESSHIHLV